MSGAVEGVALLPCPWCQSEALQILHNENLIGMEAVSCRNCGARGPHVETGKQATDGWNARTRTTPPARSYADGVEDAAKVADDYEQHTGDPAFDAATDVAAVTIGERIRLLPQGGKA